MSRGRHSTPGRGVVPLLFALVALVLVGVAMVDRYDGSAQPEGGEAGAEPVVDAAAAAAAGLTVTTAATIDLPAIPTEGLTIRVVGRPESTTTTFPDGALSVRLAVPPEGNFLVAALDGDRIVGLALNLSVRSNVIEDVTIDPTTTAEALIGLLPGVLDPNAEVVAERLEGVRTTAPYAQLVERLREESVDLAQPDEAVLDLVGRAADEVIAQTATASSLRPRCGEEGEVYANEPDMCAELSEDGDLRIANSSTRWVGVRSTDRLEPCVLVPPAQLTPAIFGPSPDFDVQVEATTFDGPLPEVCGSEIVVDAPGLTGSDSLEQSVLAGLSVLSNHTAPLGEVLFTTPPDVVDMIAASPELTATDMIIVLPSLPVGDTIEELVNPGSPGAPLVMLASAQLFDQVSLLSSVFDERATQMDDPLGRELLQTLQLAGSRMTGTPAPFSEEARRVGPIVVVAAAEG